MEDVLDFMLIDTAAGIAVNVSGVLEWSSAIIGVVAPEPTSIIDAYATIKVVLRRCPDKPINIVVNSITGAGQGEEVFRSISAVVHGFLKRRIDFLGMIPYDSRVPEAICERIPVVHYAPDAPPSRAIRLIAKQLASKDRQGIGRANPASFWDALATTGPGSS